MIAALPYLDTDVRVFVGDILVILSWRRTPPRCNSKQMKITTKATN